jgi:hypothetical protein
MILRLFYNGTFLIASKNDLDDQNLLLATVHFYSKKKRTRIESYCTLVSKMDYSLGFRDIRY